MATQEQLNQEDEQFSKGFDEEGAPPVDQSEDDAFGITPDAAPAESMEGAETVEAVAEGLDAGDSGIAPAPADAIEADGIPATEESAAAGAEGAGEPSGDDWEQKYRTLQGKYDAEVKGKASNESAPGAEMSAEEAERSLTEDFGPEFVAALIAICCKHSTGAVGSMRGDVDSIIAHLTDDAQKRHFEAIAGAHPDFMEVNESDEFQAWRATKTPEERAAVEQALATGSAAEVNAVLDEFKAANGNEAAADDGEGVRSGGIRLPEEPSVGSGDFEESWDKF